MIEYQDLINNEEPTGQYYFYSTSQSDMNAYIDLVDKVSGVSVKAIDSGETETTTIIQMYSGVILFLVIIFLVLNILILIKTQKEYGIYILNGYSLFQIFTCNMKKGLKTIIVIFTLQLATLFIWLSLNSYPYTIFRTVVFFESALIIIIFVIIMLSQLYLFKVNSILALKKKTKDNIMEAIYFLLKCCLQLFLVLIILSFLSNGKNIITYLVDYNMWKNTDDIAYTKLYDTVNSNESFDEFGISLSQLYEEMVTELDAQLINASSIKSLANDPFCKDNYFVSDCSGVIVNSNFIRNTSDLDEYVIAPQSLNNTIFVPEKYKPNEDEIINEYKKYFYLSNNNLKDEYDEKYSATKMEKESVNIIWTKDLSIFTLDPSVSANGIIEEPIIVVDDILSTSQLISTFSKGQIYFKVAEGSDPYKLLYPYLDKYNLIDEIKTTPTVFSRYSQKIAFMKNNLVTAMVKLSLLLFVYGILIANNMIIFYEKNKKLYTIKKMHGFNPIRIYANYLLDVGYSWLGSIIIYVILLKINVIKSDEVILFLVLLLMTIELVISLLYFRTLENKSMIRILKEG